MRIFIALLVTSLLSDRGFAVEKHDEELLRDLAAAREKVLTGLSPHDKEIALILSTMDTLPPLNVGAPLAAGLWGELVGNGIPTSPPGSSRELLKFERAGSVEAFKAEARARNSTVDGVQRFRVDNVIDKRNALVHLAEGYMIRSFWLEGIDTSDLVDEQILNVQGMVFEVVGTKKYPTVAGGNSTVFRLKQIDITVARMAAEQLRELDAYRIWHDDKGKHATLARFVKVNVQKWTVSLADLKGITHDVSINRLSSQDQKLIRERAKKEKPAKKKTALPEAGEEIQNE